MDSFPAEGSGKDGKGQHNIQERMEGMPSERFYRLPEEKRKSILQAAVEEFSRVPFDKVSINQIIKNAEISRGSFYTYFEDKTDVLRYIFEDMKRQCHEFCRQSLLKNEGDFWHMMEDLFHEVMYQDYTGHLAKIMRNILNYAEAERFMREARQGCRDGEEIDRWIYDHMDKSGLRLNSMEDFRVTMEFCMMVLMMAFAQRYRGGWETDQIKRSFFRKMDILKYGVLEHREN